MIHSGLIGGAYLALMGLYWQYVETRPVMPRDIFWTGVVIVALAALMACGRWLWRRCVSKKEKPPLGERASAMLRKLAGDAAGWRGLNDETHAEVMALCTELEAADIR